MKIKSLIVLLLLSSFGGLAQGLELSKKETYISKNGELPYRIMLPKHYNPEISYPMLVFLHGSGERGNDNTSQLKHGGAFFASDSIRTKFPAIVVFPQCSAQGYWVNRDYNQTPEGVTIDFPRRNTYRLEQTLLEGLIKALLKNYPVDKDRLYIGGLSMGAMGTFELVRRNPKLFAAAFAICGGANPAIAGKLDRLPWWIFHGDADQVVPIRYSEKMVEALKRLDADVQFTVYPGVDHDSWTPTFANPDLLHWLFAQTKE